MKKPDKKQRFNQIIDKIEALPESNCLESMIKASIMLAASEICWEFRTHNFTGAWDWDLCLERELAKAAKTLLDRHEFQNCPIDWVNEGLKGPLAKVFGIVDDMVDFVKTEMEGVMSVGHVIDGKTNMAGLLDRHRQNNNKLCVYEKLFKKHLEAFSRSF